MKDSSKFELTKAEAARLCENERSYRDQDSIGARELFAKLISLAAVNSQFIHVVTQSRKPGTMIDQPTCGIA
jgi:hypothetical protein